MFRCFFFLGCCCLSRSLLAIYLIKFMIFVFENIRSKALNLFFCADFNYYRFFLQISNSNQPTRLCSHRKNAVIANYTVSPELNWNVFIMPFIQAYTILIFIITGDRNTEWCLIHQWPTNRFHLMHNFRLKTHLFWSVRFFFVSIIRWNFEQFHIKTTTNHLLIIGSIWIRSEHMKSFFCDRPCLYVTLSFLVWDIFHVSAHYLSIRSEQLKSGSGLRGFSI